MRKLVSIVLITFVILVVSLIGVAMYVFLCGITPDLNYPESFTYTHYNHETGEYSFTKQEVRVGDELYDNLIKLLEINPDGWKPAFASYIPYDVFHSNDLSINLAGNTIVINYKINSVWGHLQIYKRVESTDSVLQVIVKE